MPPVPPSSTLFPYTTLFRSEGHANSLVILDGIASEEQKLRWFEGVVERGETWVAWSGEPQTRALGEKAKFGTSIEKVRSEEHTSELQSQSNLVCRLLLEKKK